jgi:hypothetical protein
MRQRLAQFNEAFRHAVKEEKNKIGDAVRKVKLSYLQANDYILRYEWSSQQRIARDILALI